MKYSIFTFLAIFAFLIHSFGQNQKNLPYKNPLLPTNLRVLDLLSRMTPDEKFRQLFMVTGDIGSDSSLFIGGIFGFQTSVENQNVSANNQIMRYNTDENSDEIAIINKFNSIQKYFIEQTRLGIPVIFYDESLHGLVRSGCVSYPQSIALAASFNTSLMEKVSGAMAQECSARGINQVLSPVVNLATDVRWGRVEETYGEDPFLSSRMGVAYVKSFEKIGIITTPKHFISNVGEGGRDSYPIYSSQLNLEENALIPFKALIKEGGSRSIMTSYNSLNGRPCSANNWLLNTKLKKEWNFGGIVISDAGGTGGSNVLHFTAKDYEDAGKQAIENGLDVIFQTSISSYDLFKKPFLDGSIKQSIIDSAVARVLKIKFDLGLFDHPYISVKQTINDTENHQLAKIACIESAVLLKNANTTLPITTNYKKILVIGPDAKEARLGGYSGPGINKVSIYDGIQNRFGQTVKLDYSEACSRIDTTYLPIDANYLYCINKNVNASSCLLGEYFNNTNLDGKPTLTRFDKNINFQWTLFSPDPLINYDFFSVRWTGFIKCPESGLLKIGIEGNDGYKMYLNDSLLIDRWNEQSFNTTLVEYRFQKEKAYKLRIEYKESSGNARIKLVWNYGIKTESQNKMQAAVKKAKNTDLIIYVAGIEEGEFRDRSSLKLPGQQEEMIHQLAKTGKPIVVILIGGSAITMSNWIDEVESIVDVWYPGEAGGEAIAELLAGDANFSGKLPITFPLNEGQLPLSYNHKPTGRGDDYNDGSGQALFPFGFGLSYTTFEYSNPQILKIKFSSADSSVISFTIKNTGKYDGKEVVQLYLRDEIASLARPIKELKGFQKVYLKAGETKTIQFLLTPSMLEMVNETLKTVIEPGFFRIMIGSSSKDIRIRERIEIF